MRQFLIAFLCTLSVWAISCSNSTETHTEITGHIDAPSQAEIAAADSALTFATTEFGFRLFREIASEAEPTENVFVSPLSVLNALVMAKNGAAGETDRAFAKVIGVEEFSNQAINETIRDLTDRLASADPGVQFKAANSIWSREGKALVPEFVTLCRDYLGATAREMDFQETGAADTINNWVAENTNGKITEMVQSPLPIDLASLLLNAVYFNAGWTYPFDTAHFRTRPFHLADGSTRECELMFRVFLEDRIYFDGYDERPIVYFTDGDFYNPGTVKGASLPYGSEGFHMTLLMPDSGTTMEEFIDLLTVENWQAWQALPRERDWIFALPKFRFECDASLKDVLAVMGLDIAFDQYRADFSNMFVDGAGWIDKIEHKTFIQVDENGTEAAAVTTVWIPSDMPPTFIADRPFIAVIHDDSTGAVLFIGLISDPEWQD